MNLEELLRAAVDDGVRSVPPGFADGAIRRARRQRRTTRIAVAGGVAAFALAAATVAVVDPTDLRTDAPPAGGGVVDVDVLATGPAPDVPWYEGGALHFGEASIPFEYLGDPDGSPLVDRISGGYVVTEFDADQDNATVTIVRDDGERIELASGLVSSPFVSPDGERMAWSVQSHEPIPDVEQQTITTRVLVADTDGEVVAELPALTAQYAEPAGYLADGRLVLNAEVDGARGVYAWDIGDEQLTPLREDADLLVVSSAGLAVFNGRSTEVADLTTGEDLWTAEIGKHPLFSPDGRYLAGTDWSAADPESVAVVLHDARSGDEVLRVAFERVLGVSWESPMSIILNIVQGTEAALVRCTVDGDCELADDLRPAHPDPTDPVSFDSPYVLGVG